MLSRKKLVVVGAALAIAVALYVTRHSLLRYRPVDRSSTPQPIEALAHSMNPAVLTGLTARRLVVEVDWIDGNAPSEVALDALRSIVAEYGPPGRPAVVERGEEIARSEWPADPHPDPTPLVERHLSHDPRGEDAVVYVLYVPRSKGIYGETLTSWVHRDGHEVPVSTCVIVLGAVRKSARLTITAEKLERVTLVHEFGHVIGLTRNPHHEQAGDPFHCTHTECMMIHAMPRVFLANGLEALFTGRLATDYCSACREDIRRAQAYWAEQAAKAPGYGGRLAAQRRAADLLNRAKQFESTDPPRAIGVLRDALQDAPEDEDIRARLAHLLGSTGALDEAKSLVATAPTPASRCAAAFAVAWTLCHAARYQEALDLIGSEGPKPATAWMGPVIHIVYAWALTGAGRLRDAADSLSSYEVPASLAASYKADMKLRAASLLRRGGDLAGAATLLDGIGDAEGDASYAQIERGRLARARGDEPKARELFREVARQAAAARAAAKPPDDAWSGIHDLQIEALASALAGDTAAAQSSLGALETRLAAGLRERPHMRLSVRPMIIRVQSLIGANAAALGGLREFVRDGLSGTFVDPCLDEDLAGLRKDPGFAKVAPWCAAVK